MKTSAIGKISGGLGLLVLLSSPFTLLVTSGSFLAAGVKAGVGLALIAAWFATRGKSLEAPGVEGTMGQGARAGFFYTSTVLLGVTVVGGLVLVNFIASRRAKTWDLTAKKIYSLAPQTTQTLQALSQPVKAYGFLPTEHNAYDALEHLFKRYTAESDKFSYEFKDPRRSPQLAAKYQLKEGQITVVLTRGTGDTEAHATLNEVSEEALTKALLKLNNVGIQKLYFLVGHGEWTLEAPPPGPDGQPSLTSMSELKTNLVQEGYAPEELNLSLANRIPKDASLVVIAGPRSKFFDAELALLGSYLDQGGRVIYFAEPGGETGLDALLAKNGVQLDNGLLADDKLNPHEPYVIVSTPDFYSDHEITRILKAERLNVKLPTAFGLSPLREGVAPGVTVTPVITTSPYAWEETTPTERPTLDPGEKSGAIPLVLAVTRDTHAAAEKRFDEGRLVVFGDAQLLVDALYGHEPNRNLAMNAIAWASNQVQNITIRPPDRDISTLDLDAAMLARIRFLAMDLLPMLLVGIGLTIWMTRRHQ